MEIIQTERYPIHVYNHPIHLHTLQFGQQPDVKDNIYSLIHKVVILTKKVYLVAQI